jgi:hypothetical protein
MTLDDSRQRATAPLPFHIYGFAVFPVLGLYVPNADYTPFSELFLPLLLSLACVTAAWAVLALAFERQKAGLLVSSGLVAFFGFNFVFRLLWDVSLFGLEFKRYRYALALVTLLLLGAAFLIARAREVVKSTRILNQIALALVLTSSTFVAYDAIVRGKPINPLDDLVSPDVLTAPEDLPDIYYILLDGYGRSDVLREVYHLDTSDFIERLERLGFYVAERSTTNYAKTLQVLTTVFNLDYLAPIAEAEGITSESAPRDRKRGFKVLAQHLAGNRWLRTLRGLGYRTVNFASGWHPTEQIKTDQYLSGSFNLTEFQNELLKMTPLRPVLREFDLLTSIKLHRDRIHYVFETLPSLAAADSPKFVFAHVMCPHFPYTFDENGGFQPEPPQGFSWNANQSPEGFDGQQYREFTVRGYSAQVRYLNGQVIQMLERLLANAPKPPIIIVQGDHGPDALCHPTQPDLPCLEEHFPILNAFYLPGPGREQVYPGITSVNTFRIVLNAYFGAGLEVLPDRNFWSTYFEPLVYSDRTAEVQSSVGVASEPAQAPGDS